MSRFKFVLTLVCINLVCKVVYSDGLLLDLFSEKDRHGLSIRLDVSDNECSNMPVPWGGRASSINTLGSCVQLYDEPFCKGSLTVIQPFHTIHQMDMSLINFANRIQSASACGPKMKSGRYVIQNAADATVLSVNSKYGGFARATTVNTTKFVPKSQQWDVLERENSEYTLRPREFGDNFPVTFDEESLKNGKIKRKLWKLMSVGRGRYLIKNEPTQRCLYKTEEDRVEEHDCRIWSPNQEWVFREIFGSPKPEKPSAAAAVGPGLNYNILSKVASFRPPTKPPPQEYPIFYNITTLAKIKRLSTPAPYQVRKKIKRGPRPKSKPIDLLSQIRPPGLLRPALPSKVSNNNNFLLLKTPGKPSKQKPEFIPSDDHIEAFAYYQQILQAQAEADSKPKLPPTKKTTVAPKVKVKDNDDDDSEEDDEYQYNDDESDEQEDDIQKPFEVIEQNLTPKPNKTDDSETNPWFFRKVYSKVKSGLGSVTSMSLHIPKIPFISSSKDTSKTKNTTHPHGEEDRNYSQNQYNFNPPPPGSHQGDGGGDFRPRPQGHRHHDNKRHKGASKRPYGYGLRQPKRPSRTTTTTTTTKRPLWSSIFG